MINARSLTPEQRFEGIKKYLERMLTFLATDDCKVEEYLDALSGTSCNTLGSTITALRL